MAHKGDFLRLFLPLIVLVLCGADVAWGQAPPVLTNNGGTVAEGGTLFLTTSNLGATDADTPDGSLSFTVDTIPANGILALSGTPLAATESFTVSDIAGGLVTYEHDGSETTTDSFDFTLSDGTTDIGDTFALVINAVDDAPSLTNNGGTVAEGGTLVLTDTHLDASDADTPDGSLSFTVDTIPANGILALSGTPLAATESFAVSDIAGGLVTYEHDGSETTTDSFDFTLSDGTTDIGDTFDLSVTPVNDAPVAVEDGYDVDEGATLNVPVAGVLGNDTDAEDDPLTAVLDTDVTHGSLTLNTDGSFSYTHDGSETTTDSFTYHADDGSASNTVAVTLTINPVNDAPTLTNNGGTVDEDGTLVLNDTHLDASDVDNTDQGLFFTVTSMPAHGWVELDSSPLAVSGTFTVQDITDGLVVLVHDGSEGLTDSFDFSLTDGASTPQTGTFPITVWQVNDPPTLTNNGGTVDEDGTLVLNDTHLDASDVDNTDQGLFFTVTSIPAHGWVELDSSPLAVSGTFTVQDITDGLVVYVHDGSETISDSFDFSLTDEASTPLTGTFPITVNPVNDAPALTNNGGTVDEDGTLVLNDTHLDASDVDNVDTQLVFTLTSMPAHGWVELDSSPLAVSGTFTVQDITDGLVVLVHDGSEGLTDSFDFSLTDGASTPQTGTFPITVWQVNDAPVAVADAYSVDESATLNESVPGVLGNDTDAEDDALTAVLDTDVTHGTLTLNPNGSFDYTHDGTETTSDSFTYHANDGTDDSNIATVTITVTPVNDAPVADPQSLSTSEDTPKLVTLTGSDVDGDPLGCIISSQPSHGTLSTVTNCQVTYNPAENYHGPDSFAFRTNDGTVNSPPATVSITVDSVNDLPIADAQSVSTPEDTPTLVTLTGSDVDGDPLECLIATFPSHGSLSGVADCEVTYTPAANYHGSDGFTFRTNDGTVDSAPATVSITVSSVNDPPTANAQSVSTPEDTPKPVTLTGSDVDGDPLECLIATFPSHGSLSGVADCEVTYTPAADYNGADSFTFRTTDGIVNSSPALVSITVTAVNDSPIASNDAYTVSEGGTLNVAASGVLTNDTDVDGPSALTAVLDTGVSHGILTLNENGSFSYTHDGSETTTDGFTYHAFDGSANSNLATVTIGINGVNDVPVANAQSVSTPEDTPKLITLTGSDADGDPLTCNIFTQPSNGTLSAVVNCQVTYTPAANYHGPDSFAFRTHDGTVNSVPATVSMTVTPVNDPPTATAQSVSTPEDTPRLITLTGSDVDGDPLSCEIATQPGHGTLSGVVNCQVTYTPAANYYGPDSFTFRTNDGTVDSAPATVSITVTPDNDAPLADAQAISTLEDAPKLVTLTGSDVDGDPLSCNISTQPSHGTLSAVTNCQVTYTPAANYFGPDNFHFRTNDGSANSSSAQVSITVTPVNDAPVATDDGYTVAEGETLVVDGTPFAGVLDNDADVDDLSLSAILVVGVSHGSLAMNADGTFTYTHDGSETTSDSFTYRATDGNLLSNLATVTIGINGVNDVPVANPQSVSTPEDTPKLVTLTGSDADGDPLTCNISTQPSHGTLSGVVNCQVTYTPAANYHGPDSFAFRTHDGTVNSVPATVSLTVSSVNDAPVADAQATSTPEDTAKLVTLAGSDVDGDPLTCSIVTQPAHGTLSVVTECQVTFTPAANYHGPDSFEFRTNDGTVNSLPATVSVTVNPVNDPPVAANQAESVPEDTPLVISLDESDVDGDALTCSISTQPAHGMLSSVTNCQVTYTPAADYHGPDAFTWTASDGSLVSNTATVTVTVAEANDAPVADAQATSTAEDTPKLVTLTGSDVDGDPLTCNISTQPSHGTLSGVVNCQVTYTPAVNYHGPDSFAFRTNDFKVNSAPATVSITVTPVNDAPVADAQATSTPEDTPKLVTLTGSDVDGDPLTCSIVAQPAHGTLSAVTNCQVTYTPAGNYHGPDSFTFRTNDGSANSNTATVTVTVTEANDTPVANAQSVSTPEDTPKLVTLTGSDVDGDPLSCNISTQPAHGTLSAVTNCQVTYTPAANYHGPDSFAFRTNDSKVNSVPATVSVTVSSINDAPVASDQDLATNEEQALPIALDATDVEGDPLTCAVIDGPYHGTLTDVGDDDCNVTYTPARDYIGPDSFRWTASDGALVSDDATVRISVAPVNDAPVAIDQDVETDEDTPFHVVFGVSDVDMDELTCVVVTPPVHGQVGAVADCTVDYLPAADYHGPDSLFFRVSDGVLSSEPAMVWIDVLPVQDVPVASDQEVDTAEDTPVEIPLAASDADGEALVCEVLTAPEHGSLTAMAGCVPTYTPTADYTGLDSFTWRASDGMEASGTATVSVSVGAVNDRPVAFGASVRTPEDTPVGITLSATDVEGDPLTCSISTEPKHGTLTSAEACQVTYTPAANYNGPDSFAFKANDGELDSTPAVVTISVSPVNDVPVAQESELEIAPDVAIELTLPASDPDGEAVVCEIVSNPSHGSLSSVLTCKVTYTPVPGFRGVDTFTWRSKNGSGTSTEASFRLLVGTGVAVDGEEELPDRVALHGNYPNPFNPTTTILFDLPEPAEVAISVFDVLGRVRMRLPATAYAAGADIAAVLDAEFLSSGMYIYVVDIRGAVVADRLTGRFVVYK